MSSSKAICAVCQQQVYRDRNGRIMAHTKVASFDPVTWMPIAEACTGWERGARGDR